MELRTCRMCGKLYSYIGKMTPFCPKCMKELEEKFDICKKYIKENPTDFYKTVGMFYVLTDGFKKIDNLIKGPVKKEVKKGIDRLSSVIDNTSRNSDGSFRLRNSVTADKEPIDIYSWNLG